MHFLAAGGQTPPPLSGMSNFFYVLPNGNDSAGDTEIVEFADFFRAYYVQICAMHS